MSKAKAATKKAPPKIDKPKKAPAKLAPKRAKVDHTHASPDDEVEHLQAHPFHEHGGPFTIEQTEDRFVITGKRPQPPLPVSLRRRNSDEDLRKLELAARTGGSTEIVRFAVAKIRAGRSADVTLGELGLLRPEHVDQAIKAAPLGLADVVRSTFGQPQREPLPAMSYEEIALEFRQSGHQGWLEEWEAAVLAEGWAVHDYRNRGGRTSRRSRTRIPSPECMAEARELAAEHVSSFLSGSMTMSPTVVFGLRPIVMAAWATAERLREIMSPTTSSRAREIGRESLCDLCGANATEPSESGRRICGECLAPFRCVRCGGQAVPEMRGTHLIARHVDADGQAAEDLDQDHVPTREP